ncbi:MULTISPECIES: glutamate synthase subunit beta [Microbacterium]|uniref:Glutamate synthase (NADPH/NADH) small chain n=1 Tax=Microbacterium phyllosphaerae TaxID=124798 RepID=A0ABS4WRC6_9MICO|nr:MULTISPECIES: glutamate synthase subunit beta [Microbacterium]MBP2378767.1 glutamate synthase (NADPH/NADH) small chain [Microbacterium phyllosphaerae]MCS3441301.1 glutamate synthase (NADPH/NADH) small chain [Microbacterium phyllosphaerae]
MADPKGFLKTTERELPKRRPVPVRIMDWKEVYEAGDQAVLKRQAGRCMDCGVPFCHQGCPLGNLIPEWNDLTWRGEGRAAIDRLHATNNFPEFTGRLCPAPCESSCVLGINQPAVTIKQIEVSIIDEAFAKGWVEPQPPARLTGKTVAVVGSGPAGLAAAQQLTRAGHTVAVFERDDRIGGLLRYGIPDFKMEKGQLESRLRQMQEEGTRFRAGVEIGKDISWADLRARYDAIVIATGSTVPRDLSIPGRDLDGVHFAMEYLVESNHAVAGDKVPEQITAEGKHVIVIGGGDTGADCIGTAHRQGALSVTNLAIGKQPGTERPGHQPWPMMPTLFEVASAHEEGGERVFLASTVEFLSNDVGEVRALRVAETEFIDGRRVPKSGTEREIPADLVLIAMGFTGPEQDGYTEDTLPQLTDRGAFRRDDSYESTVPGVFVAGDAGRGQSLIVWAIAEGRAAAANVDRFLMGTTVLPEPVRPHEVAIGLQPA